MIALLLAMSSSETASKELLRNPRLAGSPYLPLLVLFCLTSCLAPISLQVSLPDVSWGTVPQDQPFSNNSCICVKCGRQRKTA